MIACDSPKCKTEWFHMKCVGLKHPPRGDWYCDACAKIRADRKARKKELGAKNKMSKQAKKAQEEGTEASRPRRTRKR